MRLKEAWQTRGWVKLAAAVIINAVFLAFMLTCFAPVYETNDDLFLSKFVDGQLSHRTIWMPYVNIVLADKGALRRIRHGLPVVQLL